MRTICLAVAFTALICSVAQAAEIRVLTTGIVHPTGLRDVTEAYAKKTGIKVTIVNQDTLTTLNDVRATDQAADVIILPMQNMGDVAFKGGIKPGSLTPLGRLQMGLYVKPGQPHKDISTVAKFIEVLSSASSVAYNDPISGAVPDKLIALMIHAPEFHNVHGVKTFANAVAGLKKGDGGPDAVAIGLIHQVHSPEGQPYDDPILVDRLPPELLAQVDMTMAISATAADAKDAADFIQFALSPEMVPVWRNRGTYRY